MKKVPKLQKFWNLIKKNLEKMDPKDAEQYAPFLYPNVMLYFIKKRM